MCKRSMYPRIGTNGRKNTDMSNINQKSINPTALALAAKRTGQQHK
jgi:hypothetical protein